MEIFLVGGAVRDELLKRPVIERDWVVVGSTPEEMLARGYQPVGKDFPVFLHPKTHEEYALARTERKVSRGYKGFHFYATPDVSLKDDLVRRDLTINAMAKNVQTGEIIDPYHGQIDLHNQVLRHVSSAFSEDPVRILRVARFAAQLPEFRIHADTNTLMQQMVTSGEVDALVPERIWKECARTLIAKNPERFFEVLKNCGALSVLFPDIEKHADFSAFHRAIAKNTSGTIRWATLLYALTETKIKSVCNHNRTPTEYTELALLVTKYFSLYRELDVQNAKMMWEILKRVDAFRRAERFKEWLIACHVIDTKHDHTELLFAALQAVKHVDTQLLRDQQLAGAAFASALQTMQIQAITQIIRP